MKKNGENIGLYYNEKSFRYNKNFITARFDKMFLIFRKSYKY